MKKRLSDMGKCHPQTPPPATALEALAQLLAPLLAPPPGREAPAACDEPKALEEPASQKMAYTVTGFCRAHAISTPTYYRLRKGGKGPREMLVGSEVRISVEAAADWRRAREQDDRR